MKISDKNIDFLLIFPIVIYSENEASLEGNADRIQPTTAKTHVGRGQIYRILSNRWKKLIMNQIASNDDAKYRFTVDVSKRLAEKIELMAKESGRTKAEVFRTAIQLLSSARDAKEVGMHVGAWRDDTELRIEREFVNFG